MDYYDMSDIPCDALTSHRMRHDGWTPARIEKFLLHLGLTGCIREAAFMAGMSKTSAYRLQRRSPEFAEAWDTALVRAGFVRGLDKIMKHGGRLP
jgi:hypothetical protein